MEFFRSRCRKLLPVAAAAVLLCVGLAASAVAARAQIILTPNIVISQVYTRGGETGATFQSDYIELFNRGNTSIDVNGFGLQMMTGNGNITAMSFVSSRSIMVEPGKYVLIELARGISGQPLPAPDFPAFGSFTPNLSAMGGYVALYRRLPTVQFGVCPSGADLLDVVGYGAGSTCHEGGGPAPAPPDAASALLRTRGGCDDASSNAADFHVGAPNPRNSQTPASLCILPSGPSIIQFALPQVNVPENARRAVFNVTRTGEVQAPATVEYIAGDGTANDRQDYTTAWGTLRFEAGETLKTFEVLLTDDSADEENETVGLVLANPTGGATLGPRSGAALVIHDDDPQPWTLPEPDLDPTFFVRQHYHDFLNREPDDAGLAFWVNQITECGTDAACVELRRINVSGAFFQSIEFQETGFLVQRLYRAAFPETQSRPRGLPRYREFVRDSRAMSEGVVVGADGWRLRLDTNQREFVKVFVARPEFQALYPATMTNAQYVDALNANAGGFITSPLREQMIFNLSSGAFTRAEVLRMFAENRQFTAAQKNPAFVLMQYFGYLRRNPDADPNIDFSGFDFWLGKLDAHQGNFVTAEMVKAFIMAGEYRSRFSATPQ